MTMFKILNPQGSLTDQNLIIQPGPLFSKYTEIVSDPSIHSGWPVVKGTRVLVSDLYRSQVNEHSINEIIMDLKEIGVNITASQVEQACRFMIEWLFTVDGRETSKKKSF